MSIWISEKADQEFVESKHYIAYPLGNGNHTIVRSGILLLPNESEQEAQAAHRAWTPSGFKGTKESEWRLETLRLTLDLVPSISRLNPPQPAAGHFWGFVADQWAPVASLNSIYNAGPSNYAGSALNTFFIRRPNPAGDSIGLEMRVGVRDTDGYVYRVSFYVTLVGRLVQVPYPMP